MALVSCSSSSITCSGSSSASLLVKEKVRGLLVCSEGASLRMTCPLDGTPYSAAAVTLLNT